MPSTIRRGFTLLEILVFFFSSRRRHTIFDCDWSSDVCSSDLLASVQVSAPAPLRFLFAIVLISSIAGAQAPIPELKPGEKTQALQLFREIRTNAWGPDRKSVG